MTSLAQDAFGATPAALGVTNESTRSAVSWAAVVAGAVVAASTSLVLVALGSGLGFAGSSPWPGVGPSLGTFTVMAGLWLIITQWLASGLGGYITGRLRTRWTGTHTHEVFFRDTAHGFLTWSLATVLVAVVVALAASAAGMQVAPAAPTAYEANVLLRTGHADESATTGVVRAEVAGVLTRAATRTGISQADQDYLAALVSSRTGVSAAAAHDRVEASVTAVRQAADDARKAASGASIFTALSMVIGAFIASVAAAIGGRLRDEHL
jgi:hypothetical protein